MSKEWLKRFRLIIPGIIILILLIPFFVESLDLKQFINSLNLTQGSIYIIISVILGGIYYIMNLRKYTFTKPIKKINDNIKNKLISFCEDCKILPDNCPLKKDRILMHIFYRLVDNDPSLIQKSKSVMLNGLVLSTVSDIIIMVGFIPFYLFAFAFTSKSHFIWWSLILSILIILNLFVFLPKVTEKHIYLSNEQLDFIKVHHADVVREKLQESCPNYPKPDASDS